MYVSIYIYIKEFDKFGIVGKPWPSPILKSKIS